MALHNFGRPPSIHPAEVCYYACVSVPACITHIMRFLVCCIHLQPLKSPWKLPRRLGVRFPNRAGVPSGSERVSLPTAALFSGTMRARMNFDEFAAAAACAEDYYE
jgi:hypothetical protein